MAVFILMRVARDWCIYASSRTLVGSQRFFSGSICPSTSFERYRRFTSLSKRASDSQNFWRLLNTDAPVYVYRRAVFPHFAGAWAKAKRSFRTDWQHLAFSELSAPWALTISDLTSDLWDIPTDLWSKQRELFARRARMQGDRSTNNGQALCTPGPTVESVDKGKRRMEGENAFLSLAVWGWTVNPFYSRSTLVSSMRSSFHFI